jgi:hypothetical protein
VNAAREGDDWRIANIIYDSGKSLSTTIAP